MESEEQLSRRRVPSKQRVRRFCAVALTIRALRPTNFSGLGKEGLRLLQLAKQETGLKIVTEVLSERDVESVAAEPDILQIGARNAHNFQLLIEAARWETDLLKRGLSQKIEEWLLSAEYILAHGNFNVILCERGIRTFETFTRNTLDLLSGCGGGQNGIAPTGDRRSEPGVRRRATGTDALPGIGCTRCRWVDH